MKTLHNIIYLSLASVLLSACAMKEIEDVPETPAEDQVSFQAVFADDMNTKTELHDGTSVWWKSSEEINLFYGSSYSGKFTSTNASASSSAVFTGSLEGIVYNENDKFWAVYPYSSENTCDGSSVTLSVPAEQVAVAGGFADKMLPTVAIADGRTLSFYNICGGVRFSVTKSGIKSVTLKGNADETLAGKVKVVFGESGRPEVSQVLSSETLLTLTPPDNGTFVVGKDYYFIALPGTLAEGYTITEYTEEQKGRRSGFAEVSIKRSVWGTLDNMDQDVVLKNNVPANQIWYTSSNNQIVTPYQENFGEAVLTSNVYENGKGIMTFDRGLEIIGDNVFYNVKNLLSIDLPEGIETIGANVFYHTPLSEINLPESLGNIGSHTFEETKLTSVIIPERITEIGEKLFYRCKQLQSVQLPSKLKGIASMAFYECELLSDITAFPNTLTSLGSAAFEGTAITSAIIPDSVTGMGQEVFSDCKKLQIAVIGTGLKEISEKAFSSCSLLANIIIPSNVEIIRRDAFDGSGLESVIIENGVQSIYEFAFSNCKNLEEITLPESMKTVLSSAFSNSGLKRIDLGSITDLRQSAFYYCTELEEITIPNTIESWYFTDDWFRGCTNLRRVTLPDNITTIGMRMFYDCVKLASINIPDSVVSIYSEAFHNCSSLASVTIPEGVKYVSGFCHCSNLAEVILPESVEQIDAYSFYESGLTSIRIPSNTNHIGVSAFGHTALESVFFDVPGKLDISDYAFASCVKLKNVTFHDDCELTIKSSGKGASSWDYIFKDCTSLETVQLPDEVSEIGDGMFYGCTNLSSINLDVVRKAIGIEAFKSCFSLSSVSFSESLQTIHEDAFQYCSGLTALVLPQSLQTIGDCAFQSCIKISSISFPNKLESIGSDAFKECTSITTLEFPESLNTIGDRAFQNCTKISSISLPSTMESIGEAAFNLCTSLTSISLPSGISVVSQNLFNSCGALQSVVVPETVTQIDNQAFAHCSSMQRITFLPNTPPQLNAGALMYNTCALLVPAESVEAYKAADGWSYFANRISAIP